MPGTPWTDAEINILNYHGMDSSAYETPESEDTQIRYSPPDEYRIYPITSKQ